MFGWGHFAANTCMWFLALLWCSAVTVLFICTFVDWDWIGWNVIDGILALGLTSAGLAAMIEL